MNTTVGERQAVDREMCTDEGLIWGLSSLFSVNIFLSEMKLPNNIMTGPP